MESKNLNPQGITEEDQDYQGSRYAEVKQAVFANPYQTVWGASNELALPHYEVTAKGVYDGILPGGKPDHFKQAAIRTVDTAADLRWGKDGKGFRKLIHANGVCLTGVWEITEDNEFSGYFKKGSKGRIISRISCGNTAIMQGTPRAFGLAGKLYPTLDENHQELLKPASFFALDTLSGNSALHMTDVPMTNGLAVKVLGMNFPDKLILLRAGVTFTRIDVKGTLRQLYQIAELNKDPGEITNTPEFMCITASESQSSINEADFRDELLAHIFDKGNSQPQRTLSFDILVSNEGKEDGNPVTGSKFIVSNWQKIGVITFDDGVVSYNGDFVLHFPHPPWRHDKNNPETIARNDADRAS